jgi:hypothetical protein
MVAPATDIRAANATNVERFDSNDIVSFVSAARRSPLAARRSPLVDLVVWSPTVVPSTRGRHNLACVALP